MNPQPLGDALRPFVRDLLNATRRYSSPSRPLKGLRIPRNSPEYQPARGVIPLFFCPLFLLPKFSSPKHGDRHPLCFKSRGFALPFALFAILILVTAARGLSRYGAESVAIIKLAAQGDHTYEEIKTALSTSRTERGGCARTLLANHLAAVCHDPVVPWNTSPTFELPSGTIDYDSLFRAASPCSDSVAEPNVYEQTSPLSSQTCRLAGSFSGTIARRENIEGEEITVTSTTTAPSLIASPGRVRLSMRLMSTSDLIVVAGGDIKIENLQSADGHVIRVSLLSSLGDIQVGSVGPRIALLSAGRHTIEVPTSLSSLSYPLPPFRKHALRGFELLH